MRPFAAAAITCLLAGTSHAEQVTGWLAKLSVHGYVSQAWAASDDHQILGIPPGGTANYRDVALQLRYDVNRRNSAVVQLRHARFGESARERDDDAVDLDWAFYQHDFSDRLSLKAGRIPLPLGIFNETGGPAGGSPFFRAPTEFYERRYSSRTVDGALASVSVGDPSGWSVDIDGYAGRWDVDYGETRRANADDAWGAQVWVNTPWTGVRIGAGAYRCEVDVRDALEADYVMLHASVDADLDRWRLASEYLRGNLDTNGRYHAWYAQAGYHVTPRLSVHARGAVARMQNATVDAGLSEDLALAVNFAVHPNVMLKVEGHTNDGLLMDDRPFDPHADPTRTRYLIASITATY